MPPKKVIEVPKSGTGDEAALQKEQQVRDGINIENGKKTLDTHDVFAALDTLEFPDWRERLEAELAKYKEITADKRSKAKKTAADKSEDTQDGQDGQPVAKKVRLDGQGQVEEKTEGAENTADEAGNTADEEGSGEEAEEEEEEEEEGEKEGEEVEDPQATEVEDEALDNGEDSD
ncbi:hypothetical protein M7I_1488 [Glarea lozoyensis 74030]|uniref:Uncharacterized protein n=1 Tax=Glarea lozoyensis (strain ATCC 74030 / MF5533) TaxID=1104152 RepID=H0EG78_GLAL7|nr:hypothetical protein M7I_1488 [Glarea lozoyensis 74030]